MIDAVNTPQARRRAMTEDLDWAEEAAALDRSAAMWRPLDLASADWLGPAAGAVVADVGCGAGGMTVVLAERVGAGGRVYAVDAEPALLDLARGRAEAHGVGGWTRVVEADLGSDAAAAGALPEPVDLIWAAHVVHHLPDQQGGIRRLAGLLRPGGRLALAEGGFPMLALPWDVGVGAPGLEGRLTAAEAAWFGDMRAGLPGVARAPHGWPALLAAAGLVEVTARSFMLDLAAPLDPDTRGFVVDALGKRVDRVGDRLAAADRDAWARLLDREDPAWLGRRGDLYLLSVRTVHVGRRPA
jgi:SAM-dependent methyltransferase